MCQTIRPHWPAGDHVNFFLLFGQMFSGHTIKRERERASTNFSKNRKRLPTCDLGNCGPPILPKNFRPLINARAFAPEASTVQAEAATEMTLRSPHVRLGDAWRMERAFIVVVVVVVIGRGKYNNSIYRASGQWKRRERERAKRSCN